MSVQNAEELFSRNAALILVNEENTLAAVAVEPKRNLLCESVNSIGPECVVDERRLAATRGSLEKEAPDISPRRRLLDEIAVVLDATIRPDVCGWVERGGVKKRSSSPEDSEEVTKAWLASRSKNWDAGAPRSSLAAFFLDTVENCLLDGAVSGLQMGTVSNESSSVAESPPRAELEESLEVPRACG